MKKPTKIWFENDILMYDAVFDGITPHYLKLDTTINNAEFDGKHVYIKGTPHDAIIHDLDNHLITTVQYKAKSIKEAFQDKSMNRLEEIKNNFDKWEINNGYCLSSDDIEFLLARVERYEEALKKVYELDGYMFVKEALHDEAK